MKLTETLLAGAFVIEPTPIRDERGFFCRVFCAREFHLRDLNDHWVQTNHSMTLRKGTIRGLHYQVPPNAEIKLIRCVRGSIQDVIVDLRRSSPTFLSWHSEVLTEQNLKMVYVPAGFAHGFQALEDGSEATYQTSTFYTPASERGVRFDDPALHIAWMIPDVIVSAKDRALASLDVDLVGLTR
jgi:dTDP-4-dehydrorhamnose 3,5-epimerase